MHHFSTYFPTFLTPNRLHFFLTIVIWIGLQSHACFAASPPKKEANFHLQYSNNTISLRAEQADLRDILRRLEEKSGILISIGDYVHESITVNFQNLDVKTAMQHIAPNFAVKYVGENGARIEEITVLSSTSSGSYTDETDSSTGHFSQVAKLRNLDNGSPNTKTRSVKASEEKSASTPYVVDELVVKFKSSLSKSDIETLNNKIGVTIESSISQINYHVLKLPDGLSVREAIDWYKQQEGIEQVEPNYRIPISNIPNDPLFGSQWGLHNTGQNGGTVDADIDAPKAWDTLQPTLEPVVIAMIDTGIDYTHPDIQNNIWINIDEVEGDGIDNDNNGFVDDTIGWDFVHTDSGYPNEDVADPDNDPMDQQGHGTHVAGIAGAVIGNSLGIAGVGNFIKIMALRAGYKNAAGNGELENADAAQAILYAVDNNAKIINLSWGDTVHSSLIEDAVTYAAQSAIIIAAAGNNGSSEAFYPAALDVNQVLSVGATNKNDNPSSLSNYGPWVDIFAPGEDIYSLDLAHGYETMSGTSMATALVAGVAAAILSSNTDEASSKIKKRIIRSVDRVSSLQDKNLTSGRLNFNSALTHDLTLPHIYSVTPREAKPGELLTVTGDMFGKSQNGGQILFENGDECPVISWSKSTISCRLQENVTSGYMHVETATGSSNEILITILKEYFDEYAIDHEFRNAGTPQGWKADDKSWKYTLPFPFPYFGKTYTSVYVDSNGYLDFTKKKSTFQNDLDTLRSRVMIAPLWDDLQTNELNQPEQDIYIYLPDKNSVCIRWQGAQYLKGTPVNVEVILHRNGQIQFNYGPGNRNLPATVALSGGNSNKFHYSAIDSLSDFNEIQSVLFIPKGTTLSNPMFLEGNWNLISLPVIPDSLQPQGVFAPVINDISGIWQFIDGKWEVWVPETNEVQDFTELLPNRGYWVSTDGFPQVVDIKGAAGEFIPPALTAGWNLVGYSQLKVISVTDFVEAFDMNISNVWSYRNNKWQYYDPATPELSDLTEIHPGQGYWVRVQ